MSIYEQAHREVERIRARLRHQQRMQTWTPAGLAALSFAVAAFATLARASVQ